MHKDSTMTRRSGRPRKDAGRMDSRQKIIETAIALIGQQGAENLTVRVVCEAANLSIGTFYHCFKGKDDLLMYFLKDPSFADCPLHTSPSRIGDRVCELYMKLISRYMEFGETFMKRFYTTGNRSLSAYMTEQNGSFPENTAMARCEQELREALAHGQLKEDINIHELSRDICTIVKGCVFEWCLCDGQMDIEATLQRIINNYLQAYIA